MKKLINTLILFAAAFLIFGYVQSKSPENSNKPAASIYRTLTSEASKLYSKGEEALKGILGSEKFSDAVSSTAKEVISSGKDIKDIVNNGSKTIQGLTGAPEYKHTVNNYEEYCKVIYTALNNFDKDVTIKLNNYSESTYNLDAVNNVIYENFDLDYGIKSVKGTLYSTKSSHIIKITFEYAFDRERMLSMRSSSEAKAKQIVSQVIKPSMSDIQKERALHDYIVNNTSYDYKNLEKGTLPEESYTIYGVLINKKAVCEGYAKAMFRLLNMAGVENKVVIGEADGTPHAWNLVKINGSYTHLDATWDDPVTRTNRGVLSHKYFNLSDAEISKDHKWDRGKYPKGVSIPLK